MTAHRSLRRRSRRVRTALGVTLAGAAAALVAAPALAAPVGPPIQVSSQGPPGAAGFDAEEMDLAYNPSADQFLAVWQGDTATVGENEVFGRILDGDGQPLGGVFRISSMGPDGSALFAARDPAVAFNAQSGEYLVVWEGDDGTAPLVDGEFEIFGQRISARGSEVGADDFRISDMGPDGDTGFFAGDADVVHNPVSDEYMVVWDGTDDTAALVAGENEIFGQRLDPSGAEVGANDVRISDAGGDGDASRDARDPALAVNTTDNQFLVVWEADDLATDDEFEVFGQRLGQGGGELGPNDVRISDMGPGGDPAFDGEDAAVAHLAATNEYLVVWEGDDDTAPLVDGEFEIFGQRLGGGGGDPRGVNDARISDMGPDGNPGFDASDPEVTANPRAGEFMVSWRADDDTPPLVDGAFEVFGQRVSAAGTQVGPDDVRISATETAGSTVVGASFPTPVVTNTQRNEYLHGWEADSDVPPRVDGEFEVYVRRSTAGPAIAPPPPLCAAAPTPPTPSVTGAVRLTVAQLRINQRIYAAAITRAGAINAWLDAGAETRDLCAGGITARVLAPGIETAAGGNGPLDPASSPSPRPITPEALPVRPGARFRLTTGQLRINQRIAARAVREANALQARLAGGLSGGDLDDAAVTAGKITTGIIVTGATPTPAPPAPTTTVVTPATRRTGVRFTLTAKQLGINQRIGQAAIRRLNATRDTLVSGLTAEHFRPGTITAVDLAPGVAP